VYAARLRRLATPAEVGYWSSVLHNGPGLRGVALNIEMSGEGRARLVRSWYDFYLGRPADPGGLQYWVNRLQNGGGEEELLSGVLSSPEFVALTGRMFTVGTADERYVRGLYQVLLNRTAGTPDVNYWVNVKKAYGLAQVALGFLTSRELRGRVLVAGYNNLLERPLDTGGSNYWLNGGFNFTGLRVGLMASPEFFDERRTGNTPVTFNTNLQARLQGTSLDQNDKQFFSFSVARDRILVVNVQSPNGVLARVRLEDDLGTVIAETKPEINVNTFRILIKPGRTYFLRVTSSTNTPAGYVADLTLI
jgi:hypothetical protein